MYALYRHSGAVSRRNIDEVICRVDQELRCKAFVEILVVVATVVVLKLVSAFEEQILEVSEVGHDASSAVFIGGKAEKS